MLRRSVVALLLAFPATTHAAVVVESDDAALVAKHKGAQICVALASLSDAGGSSRSCAIAPYGGFDSVATNAGERGAPAGLAVASQVAFVSVQRVDGEGPRVPTVAADGFTERFAILRPARDAQFMRTFDSAGKPLGTLPLSTYESAHTDAVRFPGLGLYRTASLQPDPIDIDHSVGVTCATRRAPHSRSTFCVADTQEAPLEVQTLDACAPDRPVLFGIAAKQVTAVKLRFGDGRIKTVRTLPLPAAYHGRRGVLFNVPRHTALRSARGGGHLVHLRQGPGGYPCAADLGATFATGGALFGFGGPSKPSPAAKPTTVAEAGGHTFDVADQDHDLCAGVDGELTCGPAPVSATTIFTSGPSDFETAILSDVRSSNVIGAVVPAYVARAVVRLSGGGTRTVDTVAGEAYSGRLAGTVRFLLVDSGNEQVTGGSLLAADGTRVGRLYAGGAGADDDTQREPVPGVPLTLTRFGTGRAAISCLTPTGTKGVRNLLGTCSYSLSAAVSVTCSPRRATAYGFLKRGTSAPVLHLRGGDTVKARVLRRHGKRLWIRRVPKTAEVQSVVFPGARLRFAAGNRVPLHAVPATAQCGYIARSSDFF